MRYRPSGFWTARRLMCELLVFEGTFHRLCRGVDHLESLHVPGVEGEHGAVEAAGDRDLAQGSPSGADRDHAVGCGDDHRVARLTEPGRQREREMGVRTAAVRVWRGAAHRSDL